jgi:hypothetical protein
LAHVHTITVFKYGQSKKFTERNAFFYLHTKAAIDKFIKGGRGGGKFFDFAPGNLGISSDLFIDKIFAHE